MKPGKNSNPSRPLFFASFKPSENIKELKNVRFICSVKVTWKNYKNPKQITQCYRCQGYSHGTSHSSRDPRCVKCTGNHLTRDCTKPADAEPQCTNCKQPHPANSSSCEVYKQLINKIDENRKRQAAAKLQTDKPIPEITSAYFPKVTGPRISNGGQPQPPAGPQRPPSNYAGATQGKTTQNTDPDKYYSYTDETSHNTEKQCINDLNTFSTLIDEIKKLKTLCDSSETWRRRRRRLLGDLKAKAT